MSLPVGAALGIVAAARTTLAGESDVTASADDNAINQRLFVPGDFYRLDYRQSGQTEWIFVSEGNGPTTTV